MKSAQTRIRLIGILIGLSVCLYSCTFSAKTTKRLFKESENEQYDVIIVPGMPFEEAQGAWGRIMKGRVYWSKYLYDRGIAKNVMYSGGAVYTPYTEAEIMKLYAVALGIPEQNIYTETRAEHSTENVYYSYQKARKLGFKKIAVASDHFQTKSLRRFIRKRVSPDVKLIPFVVDTLKKIGPDMKTPIIDFRMAFKEEFISIKDRESVWKRWRGTRGHNIDTLAYR